MSTLYASELFPVVTGVIGFPMRERSEHRGVLLSPTADFARISGIMECGGARRWEGGWVPEADNAKLTLAAIVEAAIDVADRDGLGGLSMRRIADVLGVGTMSLYRHVADKDALLQQMSEEIGRRFPYPVDASGSWTWRERVQIAVDVDWELYRRHPWVVLAYSSPRHSFGDLSLVCLDWFAAGFLDLGVEIDQATEMALTVWNFVSGVALVMVSDALLWPDSPSDLPNGLAELASGKPVLELAHLSELARRPDVGRLLDSRARLDAGIEYLCAGFEAASKR